MLQIIPMTVDEALKAADTYASPVNGTMVGVLAAAVRELRAENLAQAAIIKKAELLAAHLQELNSAIMENVNRAMEIVNGK